MLTESGPQTGRKTRRTLGTRTRTELARGEGLREQAGDGDLCEVSFVNGEGRKLLASMHEQGARFRTFGCMAKGIVEEIVREHSRSR